MATILIVDDHAANREFLVTLLKHGGHRLTEASDGSSALQMARDERPDLVISDILMPSGDGYELVRSLRREPLLAEVPVVFYTAHFNEREALNLARACGVKYVLTKPAEPGDVLRVVQDALAGCDGAASQGGDTPQSVDQHYLRLVSSKLVQTTQELEWTTSRLMALIEMCIQIAAEREPEQMVKTFCRWTRDLVAARHAVVGLWEAGSPSTGYIAVSGLSDEAAEAVEAGLTSVTPHPVPLSATGPLRRAGPVSDADDVGLPWAYPPVGAMLVVPVKSPTRQYGWVCATSKISGQAFSADDERLLTIFASYLGRIFENHCLLSELSTRSRQLEMEVAQRAASQWRAEMQFEVARVLAQTSTIEEAAPEVLKAICTKAGFTIGELWEINRDEERLCHVATWHAGIEGIDAFMAETKAAIFSHGGGMPGQVWRDEAPVWVADVEKDAGFLRSASASAAGIKSAVAFPVVARGRIAGVLGFFGENVRPPDPDLVLLFRAIGGQVGQFIDRRAQEERLARLSRMHAMLASAGELISYAKNKAALFDGACRIAIEDGKFAYAQVRIRDEDGGLSTVASARLAGATPKPDVGGVDRLTADVFAGRGPVIDNERGFSRAGDGSCAGLPLDHGGKVRAVLVLHSSAPGFFTPSELVIVKQVAVDISMALDSLQSRGLLAAPGEPVL